MNRLGSSVARPFLVAATDAALGFSHLPIPLDAPRVHAPGPDPDRLLLVGTAAAVGVGVASHQLGLGGQLARRISALTGRGVDLEIEGAITLTADDALRSLSDRDFGPYDAVVLLIGSREAMGLQRMRIWKPKLREILQTILESDAAPHVLVIGAPPIYRYDTLPDALAERLQGNVDRQNSVSATVCEEFPRVTFLALATPSDETTYRLGSAVYEKWAERLAPSIVPWLASGAYRSRSAATVDEPSRQAALDALHVVDSATDARIDRIARTARDLLGASGASVTFLDHERQWIKSAVSMSSGDTERATSFCNTTITRHELFVVEDAAADNAFAEHPWVVGEEHVRFYAGYPVEAPNGERIGALCVVDTKPRHFSGAEAALLRELALRVQTLLWAG